MKNGRLQCKDIPDKVILEFLYEHFLNTENECSWVLWQTYEGVKGLIDIFPQELKGGRWDKTIKLPRQKMWKLIQRGLINGCTCGCRGDFEIIDKGILHLMWLKREDHYIADDSTMINKLKLNDIPGAKFIMGTNRFPDIIICPQGKVSPTGTIDKKL